jgi:hypothetical protein
MDVIGLGNFISSIFDDIDVSPEQLHEKAREGYQIESKNLLKIIDDDLITIKDLMSQHGIWHLDYNDLHVLLRRILARPNEFTEESSEVRRIFAHICISHNIFQNLVSFLNGLVMSFGKMEQDTKGYYQRYLKIQSTLLHLRRLHEEHERYLNRIRGEITGDRGPWHVKLPEPYKIKQLVSDAFIDLQGGILNIAIIS